MIPIWRGWRFVGGTPVARRAFQGMDELGKTDKKAMSRVMLRRLMAWSDRRDRPGWSGVRGQGKARRAGWPSVRADIPHCARLLSQDRASTRRKVFILDNEESVKSAAATFRAIEIAAKGRAGAAAPTCVGARRRCRSVLRAIEIAAKGRGGAAAPTCVGARRRRRGRMLRAIEIAAKGRAGAAAPTCVGARRRCRGRVLRAIEIAAKGRAGAAAPTCVGARRRCRGRVLRAIVAF